jgi:hypothetical protein
MLCRYWNRGTDTTLCGFPPIRSRDRAEAALAFLAEQDMVVVDGDKVSIPPRFADEFVHPPAQLRASEDQISVG